MILTAPFLLAGILYLGIILVFKTLPPYICDGVALIGVLISFILFGIGVMLNLVNLLHRLLKQ